MESGYMPMDWLQITGVLETPEWLELKEAVNAAGIASSDHDEVKRLWDTRVGRKLSPEQMLALLQQVQRMALRLCTQAYHRKPGEDNISGSTWMVLGEVASVISRAICLLEIDVTELAVMKQEPKP